MRRAFSFIDITERKGKTNRSLIGIIFCTAIDAKWIKIIMTAVRLSKLY
ncbi:MAG: hypothetical protein ACTS6H_00070 [Candidatus Hodgkinia cicadicola]